MTFKSVKEECSSVGQIMWILIAYHLQHIMVIFGPATIAVAPGGKTMMKASRAPNKLENSTLSVCLSVNMISKKVIDFCVWSGLWESANRLNFDDVIFRFCFFRYSRKPIHHRDFWLQPWCSSLMAMARDLCSIRYTDT